MNVLLYYFKEYVKNVNIFVQFQKMSYICAVKEWIETKKM